jgi:DNA repair photolyase
MINKPIYKPSGKAAEYGDYAINIYTGCPHGCTYCFAPSVLHKHREEFHAQVEPRHDIVESVKRQLDREKIIGKLIHLCFSCDPYPVGYDTTPTRDIIKLLKESGNHVQILTKGGEPAERDFNLLDADDWFGVTYTLSNNAVFEAPPVEPNAAPAFIRLVSLERAKKQGISTWISLEPVLDEAEALSVIKCDYIDLYRIGKLNYAPSPINWALFGLEIEAECIRYGRNYYIKQSLRDEMNKERAEE